MAWNSEGLKRQANAIATDSQFYLRYYNQADNEIGTSETFTFNTSHSGNTIQLANPQTRTIAEGTTIKGFDIYVTNPANIVFEHTYAEPIEFTVQGTITFDGFSVTVGAVAPTVTVIT